MSIESKILYYKENNFDLIRLFAALQVVIVHLIEHFHATSLYWLSRLVSPLPGVPIFFFISGFLISAAWERNPDIKTFALNRVYRVFPGLWVCVLFSAISVLVFYDILKENLFQFLLWILTQGSIVQVWNPEFLRGYGIGVVNGSLWTIAVEICFYIFIPIIYFLKKELRFKGDLLLVLVAVCSFAFNYFLESPYSNNYINEFKGKLLFVSPLPWIGMFCVGILFNRNLKTLYAFTKNKFWYFLILFICISSVPFWYHSTLLIRFGNSIGILNYIVLCFLIMSAAYSSPRLSDKILRRNDISYGVYIYHQPLLNVFIVLGFQGSKGVVFCLLATLLLALISWKFIERPALLLKKKSLHVR